MAVVPLGRTTLSRMWWALDTNLLRKVCGVVTHLDSQILLPTIGSQVSWNPSLLISPLLLQFFSYSHQPYLLLVETWAAHIRLVAESCTPLAPFSGLSSSCRYHFQMPE